MDTTNFWNYLDLPTPVLISSRLICDRPHKIVVHLKSVMNQIKNTFNDLKKLNTEAALLSRLIYKTKHKLRQEKSFKALQKINKCLTNYLTMHLPFTLSSIKETLHQDCGPTRQMLEWALVRLYGVAHLFHRVYQLCIDAAGHLLVRIKLAHLWDLTFFSIAIVSRIWTFSQFLVRNVCEWYRTLYQFQDKLASSSTPWLPSGCVLPQDLAPSLGNPTYLTIKPLSKPSEILSQLRTAVPEGVKQEVARGMSNVIDIVELDDLGESVSREVLKENNDMDIHSKTTYPPKKKKIKPKDEERRSSVSLNPSKKYNHAIENIKSSKDLTKFLNIESAFQNSSSKVNVNHRSVLQNMDKLQWSVVKQFITKEIKAIKKSEISGNSKKQEQLLKKVRKNIKTWVSS